MNEREMMRAALAECAAISGEWLRRVDQARDKPEQMEELGRLIPSLFADVMQRAAGALEASGYDVAAEVDAAVERLRKSGETKYH